MAQQELSLLNNYMLYQRSTPFFPRDKYMLYQRSTPFFPRGKYMLYQRSTPFFPRDKYMRFGYDFLNIHFHLLPLRKNFIKFFLNGNK